MSDTTRTVVLEIQGLSWASSKATVEVIPPAAPQTPPAPPGAPAAPVGAR